MTYDSCAADDCDRPYAWTEQHHEDPWASGGHTNLAKAVPLCGFHHRRMHHTGFHHRIAREPTGRKRVDYRARRETVRTANEAAAAPEPRGIPRVTRREPSAPHG